ncbi:MAG: protein-export chaperone SecB [Desulfobacteraceae bacterium]|jgi:preprotein translocase subunit SecB|nr:protein-export chaperone SecB [Desulfobacteraceae bacterium]
MNTPQKMFTKVYGIQLENISVVELHIQTNREPDFNETPNEEEIKVSFGHSEYDSENKVFLVAAKLEIGVKEDSKSPYSLKVEIVGNFCVDENEFSVSQIDDWAERNAPFILYPYIREHTYALMIRSGFKPIILPLLETPVLQQKKES